MTKHRPPALIGLPPLAEEYVARLERIEYRAKCYKAMYDAEVAENDRLREQIEKYKRAVQGAVKAYNRLLAYDCVDHDCQERLDAALADLETVDEMDKK